MAVRIEKTFEVRQPVDAVWPMLADPRKVVSCVPGAQITEAVDDRNFKGSIRVKIGPSVTEFKGDVRIERLDEQAHQIEITGKGQDVRGKGSASMTMQGTLSALPGGGTQVRAVSEVTVVGILAQFGARMMNDVADVIFKDFTTRFQHLLDAPEEAQAPAEPVSAVKLAGSVLGQSIRRVLGGDDEKSK
jgi:carbon monoxide dehydrogenase subunit G